MNSYCLFSRNFAFKMQHSGLLPSTISVLVSSIIVRSAQTTNGSLDHGKDNSYTPVLNISADFDKCVTSAADHIRSGHVIAIPTDTIYGLAADAQNVDAIKKLYLIKNRASFKALAICVPDVKSINQSGYTEHLHPKILDELLPGPVTIILRRTPNLNKHLNPDKEFVAIRIPKNDFLLKVMAILQKPIALSSANKSGGRSSVNITDFAFLWPDLDAVYDGGTIGTARDGSTIVDLSGEGEYEIIREGAYFKPTKEILQKYALRKVSPPPTYAP